jgi:hypothetical protein
MKRTIIIILILLLLGSAWSFLEPYQVQLKEVEIKFQNLDSRAKNLKIVQISDIHFKKIGVREKKLLKILKKIEPDYLLITGDIVDWKADDLDSLSQFCQSLSGIAKKGTFGVYGNHEHLNFKFSKLKPIFEESGIKILENQSIFLEESIYLIGADDPHLGFDNLKIATDQIDQKAPKILLAHSPEIFRKVKQENILVLAGHTHGGQINVPIIVNLILPLRYNKQYKKGLFKEGSRWLYINKGIGTTFLPLRFNSLPEITIIRLNQENNENRHSKSSNFLERAIFLARIF